MARPSRPGEIPDEVIEGLGRLGRSGFEADALIGPNCFD